MIKKIKTIELGDNLNVIFEDSSTIELPYPIDEKSREEYVDFNWHYVDLDTKKFLTEKEKISLN